MTRASKKTAEGAAPLVEPLLFFQNLGDPIPEDTEPDKCVGLRHVEHDLDPRLFPLRKLALQTEIFFYWNNPGPEDYLVIDESNENEQVYILTMPKENIVPDWATTYCTVQEPGEALVESNRLRLRIKLERPAFPDPDPDKPGNQGLVVFLPADIEAGAVVDAARVALEIILDVQPYANMAEYDTCKFAWGSELFTYVVKPHEVSRGFNVTVPTEVIYAAGSDELLTFAMTVVDAVGNNPHFDPESDKNWSPTQWITVDLGTRPLEAPFLKQPGNSVELSQLGDGPLKVQLFLDPAVFDIGDVVRMVWDGRDAYDNLVPYSDAKTVERTNSFMSFDIPNERLKALGGGFAQLSCRLNKGSTDNWVASKKTESVCRVRPAHGRHRA